MFYKIDKDMTQCILSLTYFCLPTHNHVYDISPHTVNESRKEGCGGNRQYIEPILSKPVPHSDWNDLTRLRKLLSFMKISLRKRILKVDEAFKY